MARLFLIVCSLVLSVSSVRAQENEKYAIKVASEDAIIETLYAVISGEKGEERNWELFRYLFKPESRLIPTVKGPDGVYNTQPMIPEDYIKAATDWFETTGFYEKEIFRKSESFGNITHLFSTYESFRNKDDKEPFMRGINSIQLLNDGDRWWVITIYWTPETESNPIPAQYLPKSN